MKARCIETSFMEVEHSKISKGCRRDCLGMVVLCLELLALLMGRCIRGRWRIVRKRGRGLYKGLMGSLIKGTLGMISSMELVKFVILISRLIRVTSRMD